MKRVKVGSAVVAMLVLFLAVSTVSGQENLVQNPGFEDGTGDLPENWSTFIQAGDAGNILFAWVTDEVHSGSKAVKIAHMDSAMSAFTQTISVKPNYEYKVSGWIKTADVDTGANWWEGGAQLAIKGDVVGNWWDNMTSRLGGTNDWTYVEKSFTTTDDAQSIEIQCKLGEGMPIKGTAWFDDISVVEVKPVAAFFENGGFEEEDPDNPGMPKGWYLQLWKEAGTYGITSEEAHSGSRSAFVHAEAGELVELAFQQDRGPEPEGLVDGAYYKISGWIKTVNWVGGRGACFITAWDNHSLGGVELHGDNDWTYVEELVQYHETAWGFIRCYAGNDGTAEGTVYFDDVQVEYMGLPPEPPAEVTIDYDGSQIVLNWQGQQQSNPIDHYLINRILPDDTTGNVLYNGGFELPNSDYDFPDGWRTWDWGSVEPTVFAWETENVRSGFFCASIEQNGQGWGMLYTRVSVPEELGSWELLLRGYVKTDSVQGSHGAAIGFHYDAASVPQGLFGTNDYTKMTAYEFVRGRALVTCLLGRQDEQVSGKVWFDDLTAVPFKNVGQTTETTFTDTDIIADTTYYYSIRAIDTKGLTSDPTFLEVNLKLPERVTIIGPVDSVRVVEPRLTWQGVIGVKKYHVEVMHNNQPVWTTDLESAAAEVSVLVPEENLQDDSLYTWTVQYVLGENLSEPSDVGSFIYTKWPTQFTYLSDLDAVSWENGWGDGHKDLSNDGNTISIGGVTFDKGLGVHAYSRIVYDLPNGEDTFMAYIGHDDESACGDGVIFKVYSDTTLVFVSEPKLCGDPPELIRVYLGHADSVQLVVEEGGNNACDHADWAEAIIYKRTPVGVAGREQIPRTTRLIGNYPNPFNPTTTISFELAKTSRVTVTVFNLMGQRIAEITNSVYGPGRYNVKWNGKKDNGEPVASGVYLYRFSAGSYTKVGKMLMLK